jgi:hypothetical protein
MNLHVARGRGLTASARLSQEFAGRFFYNEVCTIIEWVF